MPRSIAGIAAALCVAGGLATCGLVWPLVSSYLGRMEQRDPAPISGVTFDRSALRLDLGAAKLALGDEAHVRIYKREHLLELWMRPEPRARYVLFKSYAICAWSGTLGPKLAEGDRQAPEGFYRVASRQLNPRSRHHLAFNLGFPNAFDRGLGRTGSALMVHGGCSSVGCYAMGDEPVDEIYAVVEAALARGQREVDVAIFPFRMTERALSAEAASPWLGFWQNLKQGDELFARDGVPPKVGACNGTYRFGADAEASDCEPIAGWA